MSETGRRRSLTHVGGAVTLAGAKPEAEALGHALDVRGAPEPKRHGAASDKATEDDPDRAHVHGFHAYPARMHPDTASRLVAVVSRERETVLDPFCGSGTVLVSAMIAARDAIGTDLNPLAVLLASRKVSPRDERQLERMLASARGAAELADTRRKAKTGASRRYPREDAQAFDPHVLLELDSLRTAIEREKDSGIRDDLWLVLSAILVKVSRRKADTSEHAMFKRIAAGYPSRLFVRKAEELARRASELARLLPSPRPRARVRVDDARALRTVKDGEARGVVTSPPYVGTYDYLEHHAMRLRWLGLDARQLERGEMGSRRRFGSRHEQGVSGGWERELGAALAAMRRTLARSGRVALLIADSEAGGRAVRADEVLGALAPSAGLRFVARASQPRPHFHGPRAFAGRDRFEHAILLERV